MIGNVNNKIVGSPVIRLLHVHLTTDVTLGEGGCCWKVNKKLTNLTKFVKNW